MKYLLKKIVIGILLVLALTNALWLITSAYPGPFIALIFYTLTLYLCWRKNDFRAGCIIGIIGLAIHLFELIVQGVKEFGGVDLVFFSINLIFPIPLIYFSAKAERFKIKHEE